MNFRFAIVVFLILAALLAVSCSQQENLSKTSTAPEGIKANQASQRGSLEGWEADWERTLQAARKEGKVVVYALSSGPVMKDMAPTV